jgi:uncharacterized cupredoxin-like copper-binding protein
MTTRRTLLTTVALSTLGSATFLASAGPGHDKPHSNRKTVVKKEQMDWGIGGDAKNVKRTIEVGMTDQMQFTPSQLDIQQNETIQFRIKNNGKIMHEFVLGTKTALQEHAALMIKFPNMEHDAPYMAHVAPGKTEKIIWQFNKSGDFDFACLIAGHYQAGMVGKIKVSAA